MRAKQLLETAPTSSFAARQMLLERVALEELEFQAKLRQASPGMLRLGPVKPAPASRPIKCQKIPIKDKREFVLDFYASGKLVKEIAAECDMFGRDVRRIIQQARLRGDTRAVRKRRPTPISAFVLRLPTILRIRIREAAKSRALDEEAMIGLLVEHIINDDLIDAILDDET